MKKYIFASAALLMLTLTCHSQTIPSYVPSNGLVGWWPFNGNANDESGNGHNGVINGATITSDRWGNSNSAFSFNGISSKIEVPYSSSFNNSSITISAWVKPNNTNAGYYVARWNSPYHFEMGQGGLDWPNHYGFGVFTQPFLSSNSNIATGTWKHVVATYNNSTGNMNIYINGTFDASLTYSFVSNFSGSDGIGFGCRYGQTNAIFNGDLDDIGIWNRALTQNEITQLYTGSPCITYQTITVTDTLIINANLTGVNPVTFQNSIKVYPNPTSTYVTVDFGNNYNTLSGYSIRIDNALGQTVFTTTVNQQIYTSSLSSWSGNGLYLVYLLNAQGSVVDVRKIIVQ